MSRAPLLVALVAALLAGRPSTARANADDTKPRPRFAALNHAGRINTALLPKQAVAAPEEGAKGVSNMQWDGAAGHAAAGGVSGDAQPQMLRKQRVEGEPIAPDDELSSDVASQPGAQPVGPVKKVTPWASLVDKAQSLIKRAGELVLSASILSWVGQKLSHTAWGAAAGAAMIASAAGIAYTAAALAAAATVIGGMILMKHGQKLQGAIITLSAAAMTIGAFRAAQGDRAAYKTATTKVSQAAAAGQDLQASYIKPNFFLRVWNGMAHSDAGFIFRTSVQLLRYNCPGCEAAFRGPLGGVWNGVNFLADATGGWVGASNLINPYTGVGPGGAASKEPRIGKDCAMFWANCTQGDVPPGTTYKEAKGPLYGPNGPVPSDINQGALGDCYFESSMAALARQNPNAIKNMIHDNGDGTYTVTFYRKRKPWEFWQPLYIPTQVTVDNKFPAGPDGRPVFQSSPDALWPMILEKAYAKYHGGSYGMIGFGGYSDTAMQELTGHTSRSQSAGSTTIAQLAQWDSQKQAVAVGTKKNPGDNLVGSHAYYVIGVDPVHGTVTLANPWGRDWPPITLTQQQFQRDFSTVYVNPG